MERNQILKILSETSWRIEGKDGAAAILGLHSEMADLDKSQRMLMYDDTTQGVPLGANWLQSHEIPL